MSNETTRDLGLAWRRLRQTPGFTVLAVLILGLTIGANTAIFSLVEGVLLRPLPFAEPGRLMTIWEDHSANGGGDRMGVAPATLEDFRRTKGFSGIAAQWPSPFILTSDQGSDALSVSGNQVSPNFFEVLGVPPLFGRTFDSSSTGQVVVLSHALWQERFEGDPAVIGRKVVLSENPYTILGVMPRDFRVPLFFLEPQDSAELWVLLEVPPSLNNHADRILQAVGRLASDASRQEAQAELAGVGRRLTEEVPDDWRGVEVATVPLQEQIAGNVRPVLLILQGAAVLVLLIACANLASLLLARALNRAQEMSVRAAFGAGRARLVRLVLSESLVLALIGGALGLLLGAWGTSLMTAFAPPDTPRLEDVRLDPAVFFFTFVLSLITGLAFGLWPALRMSRSDLQSVLREGGKGGFVSVRQGRFRDAVMVLQVALTLLLLIGAGLLGRSFLRLLAVDPGFRADRVLTLKMALPPSRYSEPSAQSRFYEDLLRDLRQQPGIVAAGGITRLPLDTGWGSAPIEAQGVAAPGAPGSEPPMVGFRRVTSGYFDAMGIPLLAGRDFRPEDEPDQPPVVVINQALAQRFFPGRDAVGGRIRIVSEDEPWREVAGVVGDVVYDSLASASIPELFAPHTQFPSDWFQIVVRTSGNPLTAAGAVRGAVRALDRDIPLVDLRPLSDQVTESIARPRFSTYLLGTFAAVALALAAVGVFGLTAYLVAQRTREIGIRVALGARQEEVTGWILGRSLRLALAGVILGLAAGGLATRSLADQLFGVSAADPVTFLSGALFLTAVCLTASYLPARKAARVDPVVALRHD